MPGSTPHLLRAVELAHLLRGQTSPNPMVGAVIDEGVEVVWIDGEVAEEARLLNQPFRKHARTGRPLVVFKSATTLDGKVATVRGDSQWISSEASRARAHRWRAESDAVAVGIGTALFDDPQLTARIEGVARQPRRVVFDSEARLPLDSQVVRGVAEVPVTVVCSRAAARTSMQSLESAGVDVIVATGQNEAARVQHALGELGARDVQSLLLEGGPHLAGAFLEADEIDEARIFVAPLLTGGQKAKTAVEGIGIERIAAAPRALEVEVDRLEDDVLIIARLKDW